MNIKITKSFYYQILFAICVGVTYLNNYELTFAIWVLALLFTIKKKYSLGIIQQIFPYLSIFLIALIAFFFYNNSFYNAIRDITYLIKPIVGLILGYQLCRSEKFKPFETIIYVGFFIAIIHLTVLFYNVVFYRIINIHILRGLTGYFSDFEVYSFVLILFHKQLNIFFSRKKFLILAIIVGVSAFLYLSRTNFIQFVILYIGLKGYFRLTKKAVKIFTISTFFILIGYAFIYNTNPTRNGKGLEALFFKIKNAPIEPFKTKVDKDDYQDFNDNYRSFENIKTVKQVSMEGVKGILIGKGIGSTVDIGRKILTNDGTFVRHEPYVHNAYMTVFLKSGLIGVFFLIYSLYILIKQNKIEIEKVKQINLILISTGVFLILANWVLIGLYLKLDNKSLLIGLLICYREMIIKNKKNIEIKAS
jgi:hypothetical protein